MYVPSALFVRGDAAATANNIAAHESLFRLGIVSDVLGATLWLFVPLALYRLLKGVDQELAVLMVILGSLVQVPLFLVNTVTDVAALLFDLMQVPLFLVNTVTDVAALLFARGFGYLSVLDKPQRDAFVRLSLDLHHQLDLANFMFAGLWLFPFGLLVYRSRFLPRFLAVWLILAGFAWLAFSLTGLLFPAYEDKAFSITQPIALGEVATMFWLVIMGAKPPSEVAATPSAA